MGISPDVMIMTRAEFSAAEDRAFQRGVARGRFEQNWDNSHRDNPPEGPSKSKDAALPDAAGGPKFIRTWLANALFLIERNPAIKDQDWFDFLPKADRMIAVMADRCPKCGGVHGTVGEDCDGPARPAFAPLRNPVG